jgi:ribose transport system substrate-binding protein
MHFLIRTVDRIGPLSHYSSDNEVEVSKGMRTRSHHLPPRPLPRVAGLVAAAVLAATAVAACSSGSTDSTSGSGSSASNPATTSKAGAAATAAQANPAHILQTIPLASKPGKHLLIYINPGVSGGVEIGQGEQAAANALGWSYKTLSYSNENPTTLVTAMKQALQFKPVAVSFSGAAQSVWANEVSAYQQAGVFILPTAAGPGVTISKTVPANIGDFTDAGKSMGSWFISATAGKGDALEVNVPALPVLTESLTGMNEVLKAQCPGCKTTTLDATLTQIGGNTLVSAIVSELRENPSIKYVISSYLPFTSGLPAALKAAGLTGIIYAGAQPDPSDLQAIQSGDEAMAAIQNNVLLGWMAVDSIARASEGMTVPAGDGGAPSQLLVKSNINTTNLLAYALPPSYQREFKALWKLP